MLKRNWKRHDGVARARGLLAHETRAAELLQGGLRGGELGSGRPRARRRCKPICHTTVRLDALYTAFYATFTHGSTLGFT